jgi:vacuolar-type H+-ATPase subunit H
MPQEMLNDKEYDIISVIYNASQAAETCQKYIQDAQREGDRDVMQFFNEVVERNVDMIQKGKELLKKRLQ